MRALRRHMLCDSGTESVAVEGHNAPHLATSLPLSAAMATWATSRPSKNWMPHARRVMDAADAMFPSGTLLVARTVSVLTSSGGSASEGEAAMGVVG